MTPARLKQGLSRLVELVIPNLCAACDAPIGHEGRRLCLTCWTDLSTNVARPYCRRCGADVGEHLLMEGSCALCRDGPSRPNRFDRFVSVGRYEGVLRKLVLRFKREFILDDFLGELLGDAIVTSMQGESVDFWTPIPSHWLRRAKRRFQPTELLARRALAPRSQRPTPLLVMTRNIEEFHAQPHWSLARRTAALKGAFAVSRGHEISGACVGLIDDVTTTGATLAEAAHVLRAAGARRLVVAVIARRVDRRK